MLRSLAGKVMWVGRTAATVLGLALVLALVFGVATTAIGATGGNFILGKANSATTVSKLTASVAGPALSLVNRSSEAAATALNITVASGKAPIKVNAEAGTATNLSADRLDGNSAEDFYGTGQKVLDSEQLDGYDANELVRASSAASLAPVQTSGGCQFTPVLSKQVTVPANGVLLVQGGLWSEMEPHSSQGEHANVHSALQVGGENVEGSLRVESLGHDVSDRQASQSQSVAVDVTAGPTTVALVAAQCNGSAEAVLQHRSLTTLFVPFGEAGSAGTPE